MAHIVRKVIFPAGAKPLAPYSPGVYVSAGPTLYISGQIGIDEKSGELVKGGFEPECRKALNNLGEVLKTAGASYKNVVKATVLLADINDFAALNKIYGEYFTENHPARAAYQVAKLPKGAQVEIEAVAVVGTIIDIDSKL